MADNQNVSGARYSAINSMHYCQLWAYLVYKEKLIGFKNPFAKFGVVFHDILEEYGKHCILNKLETDYAEFDKIKYKHIIRLEESQLKDAKNVLDIVKDSVNWAYYLQFDKIEIEQRYAVNENLDFTEGDPYLSGGIDIVCFEDETAYIEDYKTVRSIYTKAYMEESLQRRIYAFLIMKKYPQINITKFAYNFVRYAYKSEYYTITREELPELQMRIKEEVDEFNRLMLSNKRPDPSAGDHCILCENRANCSAYKNAFDVSEHIQNEKDAIRLYQSYKLAKIKFKNMEESLKYWIDNNNPIRLQYEEFGPQPSDKIEFNDLQKVMEILEKAEVPKGAIYDKLSLSNTKMKEIIKKFQLPKNVQEQLNKISTKSVVTKYKTIKISEEQNSEDEEVVLDRYL